MHDLNAGKGTAGKLLKSEELMIRFAHRSARSTYRRQDQFGPGHDRTSAGRIRNLYDTLNGATREMQQLIKDIRANPKKFLRIKLALF